MMHLYGKQNGVITERAAGAATLKNCLDGNILHSKGDPNGHYFILIVDIRIRIRIRILLMAKYIHTYRKLIN